MKMMVDAFYAPAQDGATAVIHAATVPWEEERGAQNGSPLLPHDDLRCEPQIIGISEGPAGFSLQPGLAGCRLLLTCLACCTCACFAGSAPAARLHLAVVLQLVQPLLNFQLHHSAPRRYYSRGTFAWPLLCKCDGAAGRSALSNLGAKLWGISTVVHSLMDYPLRK